MNFVLRGKRVQHVFVIAVP